jgi:hypothetical protein
LPRSIGYIIRSVEAVGLEILLPRIDAVNATVIIFDGRRESLALNRLQTARSIIRIVDSTQTIQLY